MRTSIYELIDLVVAEKYEYDVILAMRQNNSYYIYILQYTIKYGGIKFQSTDYITFPKVLILIDKIECDKLFSAEEELLFPHDQILYLDKFKKLFYCQSNLFHADTDNKRFLPNQTNLRINKIFNIDDMIEYRDDIQSDPPLDTYDA